MKDSGTMNGGKFYTSLSDIREFATLWQLTNTQNQNSGKLPLEVAARVQEQGDYAVGNQYPGTRYKAPVAQVLTRAYW